MQIAYRSSKTFARNALLHSSEPITHIEDCALSALSERANEVIDRSARTSHLSISHLSTSHLATDAGINPSSSQGINQSNLPIFNQDWWIEIARGSISYRELKVFKDDAIVGRLSYLLSRNPIGLSRVGDPFWSHFGGPVVDERLSRSEQAKVIRQLVRQLPRWASVFVCCNANADYGDLVRDVFASEGFQHTVQQNYVRFPTGSYVMGTRKTKHNKHIQRAAKKLDCVEIDAEDFVRFYKANLQARRKRSYSPLDIVKRLIEAGSSRGTLRAIAARQKKEANEQGGDGPEVPYDAAIVYVWDSFRCYYWLSTHRIYDANNSHPKPHPDAIKMLAMKVLEHAQAMKLIFDAGGVTTPGTENLYRNMFGLREREVRDIFNRTTAAERLFQKFRPQIKKSLGLF
jgi:hypothetical protein